MTPREYAALMVDPSKVFEIGDTVWMAFEGVLRPASLPRQGCNPTATKPELRAALKGSGAKIAIWTYDFDGPVSDWWYIICDDPSYDVANFSANGRRDVRAGLRRCEVRPVESTWLAENGHGVYLAAASAYRDYRPLPEEAFVVEMNRRRPREGYECWGTFVDNRLVAWCRCYIVDGAATISQWKSDLEYRNKCPNNAMLYELTREYLRNRGLRYVTNGSRTVGHSTRVHEFCQRMGYRKAYAKLGLQVSLLHGGVLKFFGKPLVWLLRTLNIKGGRLANQVAGVLALQKIRDASRHAGPIDGTTETASHE